MWLTVAIPQHESTRKFDRREVECVLRTYFSAVEMSDVDEFKRRVDKAKELFSSDPSPSSQQVLQRIIAEKELFGPANRFKAQTSDNIEIEGGMKSYSVWFHIIQDVSAERRQEMINVLTEIAADRTEFRIY